MKSGETHRSKRSRRSSTHKQPTWYRSAEKLLDAVPDMMFRLDRAGRYLEFKPAKDYEPYVPPAEFLGKPITDVLPKSVAEPALFYIARALDTGEPQVFQYQLPMGSDVHDYEARIVVLGEDDVLAIVRDITGAAGRGHEAREAGTEAITFYGLSPRESTVLRLVAIGMTDKEIAAQLEIKPMTAHKHVASMLRKMGAASRTEASVRAVREGLLD